MNTSKVAFYLLLAGFALAICLTATSNSVTAQGVGGIEGLSAQYNGWVCGTLGRTFYYAHATSNELLQPSTVPVPVPGNDRIVSTAFVTNQEKPAVAILENGDVYVYTTYDVNEGGVSEWRYRGNLVGALPVQTTETTWGRIKADSR